MRTLRTFALSKEKRVLSYDESLDNSLLESGDLFPIANLIRDHKKKSTSTLDERLPKKTKMEDLKPIVILRLNSWMVKAKPVTIKALLDSGGSGSLVCQKFVNKLQAEKLPSNQTWTTPGGQMTTTTKVPN